MSTREKLRGLYVIVDPDVAGDRDPARVGREALEGGASMLQLRDKTREKSRQRPLAIALRRLCEEHDVLFIVNDYADLALASGAHGVHVGQKDQPVRVVRKLVGPEMIIGCSTNDAEEARRAEADGADYVSVGRLFPTGSKSDTRPATLDTLREVKAAVSVPVCAIGGIDESNIDDVLAAGADIVSVIAAVVAAEDPSTGSRQAVREAARRLAGRFG